MSCFPILTGPKTDLAEWLGIIDTSQHAPAVKAVGILKAFAVYRYRSDRGEVKE